MKKIEAVIKPFQFDEVKDALGEIGVEEIAVSEIKAYGRRKSHTEIYRGSEFLVPSIPEIKLELVLSDNQVDSVVAAIVKTTKTSKSAASRVFVSQIDDACLSHSA